MSTDLVVLSVPDLQPPTVTNISVSPSVIDVSAGSQNLTVAVNLTDDVSGVDFSPPTSAYSNGVWFTSPSGRQYQPLSRDDFTMILGTALNGTWSATRLFPQYSEPGLWRITYVHTP